MPSITERTYGARAQVHPSKIASELLQLIERKSTNLCVSVDVTTKKSLLRIVEAAGPYCCCIKVRLVLSIYVEVVPLLIHVFCTLDRRILILFQISTMTL